MSVNNTEYVFVVTMLFKDTDCVYALLDPSIVSVTGCGMPATQ